MPETALLTPFEFSDAVPAGRKRFWKHILPVKKINYKGQKVNFDKQYHVDLAQSFRDEAFDQVPLVFAGDANDHNMNPRNFGGEVLDMQARNDGTWALIEADEEAAKAIAKNPKLGVSARIRQGLEKVDGRKFGRAVEHVLLTMNPRVTTEPWQAVELSDEAAEIEVIDLSLASYTEGKAMPKTATKPTAKKAGAKPARIDLSKLSEDQFQDLIDLAQTAVEEGTVEDVDDEDKDLEVEDPTAPKRKKKSRTKIVIDKDEEDSRDDADDDADDTTQLSDDPRLEQFSQMRIDLADEKWKRDRDAYIDAGVPPFLLDLAEPVLALPDSVVIDLSDEEEVDASDIMRKMLDGVKGMIDLGEEIGHAIDLSDVPDEKDEATVFLAEWDKQYS